MMRSPLRLLIDVLLRLVLFPAMPAQRCVVRAQSQGSNTYPYYYWLSPGRIVGIAIGAVVLLLLILSALIFACRRRRRISARATSNIIVGGGPQPQPQAYQPYYGPPATKPEWYPAAGDTPYGQVRSTPPPLGEAQRTTPVREEQRTASTSQVQRTVLPDQAQRTPLRDQTQRVPSGQVQSGTAGPSGRTQNIASPVRPQEPQGPQRAAALNGRESPPPYSPPVELCPTPPTR